MAHSDTNGGSHSKNFLFKSVVNGYYSRYWIITGSTNIKSNAFKSKANNQILIRNAPEKLYNLYKDQFNYYKSSKKPHVNGKFTEV